MPQKNQLQTHQIQYLYFFLLLFLTLYIILTPFLTAKINLCSQSNKAYKDLRKTLSELQQYSRLDHLITSTNDNNNQTNALVALQNAQRLLLQVEEQGWRWRTIRNLLKERSNAKCGASQFGRLLHKAEDINLFGRSSVGSVISVLMGLVGVTEGKFVEFDSGKSENVRMGLESVIGLSQWDGYMIYNHWSSYNRVHEILESVVMMNLTKVGIDRGGSRVIAEKRGELFVETDIDWEIWQLGIGGSFDVLLLWGCGNDYDGWMKMKKVNPNIIVVQYEEYWSAEAVVVRQFEEKERTIKKFEKQPSFVGSSLSALMKAGVKTGHTLVHCSYSQPVAIFMQLNKDAIVEGIDAEECFRKRKRSRRWRLDMQAQWDAAQDHNWRAV